MQQVYVTVMIELDAALTDEQAKAEAEYRVREALAHSHYSLSGYRVLTPKTVIVRHTIKDEKRQKMTAQEIADDWKLRGL